MESFVVVMYSLFPATGSGSVLGGFTWLTRHTPTGVPQCLSVSGIKHDLKERSFFIGKFVSMLYK